MHTYFQCGFCPHRVTVHLPEDRTALRRARNRIFNHYRADHADTLTRDRITESHLKATALPRELAPALIDGTDTYTWTAVCRDLT